MLTPEQIARVYEVVDRFQLNRDWVVVPLAGSKEPLERVLPDGKILLNAPNGDAFEKWFGELEMKIGNLDLSRTARAWHPQRYRCTTSADLPPASGLKRYYNWKK